MIWRRMYCVLLCLVLCALYCFRSFADEYTLTEEDFLAPEGYPQSETYDVNGWLSSVPDEDMDFDQYQQIMEILYPELAEGDDEDDVADDEDDDRPSPVQMIIQLGTDRHQHKSCNRK